MNLDNLFNRKLKDVVTDFTGICTGYTKYSTGRTEVCITPKCKRGQHLPSLWFDIERIEVVGAGISLPTKPPYWPERRNPRNLPTEEDAPLNLWVLKAGMFVTLDDGFVCMPRGKHVVKEDAKGLYLTCDEGKHYLDGMVDDDGNLIGVSIGCG